MKLIIAGSRDITDMEILYRAYDLFYNRYKFLLNFNDMEIVSGHAIGVDQLGETLAIENKWKITQFLPDWDTYGKKAGFIRNKDMGDYGEALLAVWNGESNGTKSMYSYMNSLGKVAFLFQTKIVTEIEVDMFMTEFELIGKLISAGIPLFPPTGKLRYGKIQKERNYETGGDIYTWRYI